MPKRSAALTRWRYARIPGLLHLDEPTWATANTGCYLAHRCSRYFNASELPLDQTEGSVVIGPGEPRAVHATSGHSLVYRVGCETAFPKILTAR